MLNRIYHIHGTLLTTFFCLSVLKLHPAIDYYNHGLLFLFYVLCCIESKTMDLYCNIRLFGLYHNNHHYL